MRNDHVVDANNMVVAPGWHLGPDDAAKQEDLMTMHAAKIDDSPRLQKVRDFLRRKGSATTMEIVKGCEVCAVNSIIAELRLNGFPVDCNPVKGQRGVYLYTWNEHAQMPLFGGI